MRIAYETRGGALSATLTHTDEMRRNGITYPWVREPVLKSFDDWRLVAELFDSLRVVPDPSAYERVRKEVGEDGLVVAPGLESSPMHHVLRHFVTGTDFYLLYNDRRSEMEEFASHIAPLYEQLIDLYRDSDVDGVQWGGNYDESITPPAFFAEQILPWLRLVTAALRPSGAVVTTHCDGENRALLELILSSGVDAAESICPYPLTSLRLHEYYQRWAGGLCLIGGVPSEFLVPGLTSEQDLLDYLRYVLRAVAPGTHFIAGITDAVPPTADFDRIRRVHEFFARDGRMPLPVVPIDAADAAPAPAESHLPSVDPRCSDVGQAVLSGEEAHTAAACRALLDAGMPAREILEKGLIGTMDVVGAQFAAGDVFIPELLLAARAMQAGVDAIAAGLAASQGEARSAGTVVLGTVKGDLHDIGKNLVAIMLRGVGFEVVDLGTDVSTDQFVRAVRDRRPNVLGLSALLTTTMPRMADVIGALEADGLRDGVRVIVGGAPVTERFAREIGADGYGSSAGDAMAIARS